MSAQRTGSVPAAEPAGNRSYFELVSGRRRGLTASLLRAGLGLLSVPYRVGVGVRNQLFDLGWNRSYRAARPVVSIGNLTLGGTGKTPAVEYVARFYGDLKLRAAILSRGYGSIDGRNDEALVLEGNLPGVPHLQGSDRVQLARLAVEQWKSELLILDDGFQHRRLARDLDIVLIDATWPWGFDRLFPRGLLREPRKNLRRAHLVLLTRCNQVDAPALQTLRKEISRLAPELPVVQSVHRPVQLVNGDNAPEALRVLEGAPVAAFCGLGNPEAFRRTLLQLGCRLTAFEVFPDHHSYSGQDVDRLGRWARQLPAGTRLVTSHKDLVKLRLPQLGGRNLSALRIQLHITAGQETLDRMLKGVIA